MAALLLFGVLGAVAGFVVSPALEVSCNLIVYIILFESICIANHGSILATLEQHLSKRKGCRKTKKLAV